MSDGRTAALPGDRQVAPTSWAAFIEEQRLRKKMAPNEFARFLDAGAPKAITSDVMTRWRQGRYGAVPELVYHVAERLGVPVPVALRAAGHHVIADDLERLIDPVRLGPLVAAVQLATNDLSDEELAALAAQLRDDPTSWPALKEIKARRNEDQASDTDSRDVS